MTMQPHGLHPHRTPTPGCFTCSMLASMERVNGHEPDCPVPWADIRDEARDDRRRQERDDDAQWAAEQTTADWEWDE